MFMGDFLQFPSMTHNYIQQTYKWFIIHKINTKKVIGKSLWENYIQPNSNI